MKENVRIFIEDLNVKTINNVDWDEFRNSVLLKDQPFKINGKLGNIMVLS